MTIKKLKEHFNQELKALYPSEEIQSFFSILSETVLGYTRFQVSLNGDEELSEENKLKFKDALARLKNNEPIQYITGETEFFGLPFKVNKHTLIARPETEELVEWMLKIIPPLSGARGVLAQEEYAVLDIGTGSGCIAITLAKHLENATISALDISEEALLIAGQNAKINEVTVTFFQTDILSAKVLPRQYDVIVSNPPYVRDLEKQKMQKNVLEYEPEIALFVTNDDPLLFYRTIAQLAKKYLKPNGFLIFEINEYLSDEMKSMLETMGFQDIEIKKDIFKKPRMLKCNL